MFDADQPQVLDRAVTERGEFEATVRIDTPGEADYYRHGGILQFVLRSLQSARA